MLEALGKYQILDQIGKGSMGVVYKARDPHIGRIVALKTLMLPYSSEPHDVELISRLRQEAQAAGRLTHPNIVVIYEYGEDGDTAYIAMAYVEGRELKSYLVNQERFSLASICNIMRQLLSALHYSHLNDITHRDIKPSNIMMMPNGHVMVTDFGIARLESSELTQVGTAIGTPSYMSPEQCMGQRVDGRSDIFSAGIILYQLLTGEKPFDGPSVASILHKIVQVDPVPPSELNVTVPKPFDAILRRCLAKNPGDRYATAEDFSVSLQGVMDQEGLASAESGGRGYHREGYAETLASDKQDEAAPTAVDCDGEVTVALSFAGAVDEKDMALQPEDMTSMLSDVEVETSENVSSTHHSSSNGSVGEIDNGNQDETSAKKQRSPLQKVKLYLAPFLLLLVVSVGVKVILGGSGGQPVNPGSMVAPKSGTSPEDYEGASSHQAKQGQQESGEVLDPVPSAVTKEEKLVGQGEDILPVAIGERDQEIVHQVALKAEIQPGQEGSASPVAVDEISGPEDGGKEKEAGNSLDPGEEILPPAEEKALQPATEAEELGQAPGVVLKEGEGELKAAIQLHSVPEGVDVVIEALDIHEVTPTVLHPGPGLHQVYLRKSGFHDVSIVVSVNKEEQLALTVPMDPL